MTSKPTVDQLVADYMGWAVKLAMQCFNARRLPERDIDDIKQIGRTGLWRAAQKYDPARNVSFAAYARHWVYWSIRIHIDLYYWTPKYKARPGRRRIKEFEYTSFPDELWNNVKFSTNGTAKRVADKDAIAKVLASIPPRQASILRDYFMEGHTLQEIGDEMGLTRERIRQLKDKGLLAARKVAICGNPQKGLYYR